MKKNIKITIEYDGTNYAGWQKQKNAITIQQKVEEAIAEVTGNHIEVIGCSRTDAGVHAKGFVGNFITDSTIPPEKFKYAINNKLPDDIVILKSEEVPLSFHSRYCSKGKTYVYTILNRNERPVINKNYVYQVSNLLDLDLMTEGSKHFLGKHYFDSFRKSGSSVKSTERTIYSIDIKKEGEYITIKVTGDGFLYNMVRIMVGTLIEVGIGKIPPTDISNIIRAKDRARAGKSVPPQGLCLHKVFY
ncbi:MAG: tRNA pseudouridine(38-40) synthase TruA [Clostridium sp.]|nr:tRNA pseudouridine(38-40) synthase TruA [Clostridium sp.]